jgi:hypothetical protein
MVIQMIERNKNIFIKKAKNLILDYLTKMVWGVFGYKLFLRKKEKLSVI